MALTGEQRQNAAVIISVGRQLGASQRDIMIALMTALQESSLRNLSGGHLDSVGLFQQRTRGWANASIRKNPYESARMFFTGGYGGAPGLFDQRNRNNMSLSAAAQSVQRSANPGAYAKWEDEAASLIGGGRTMSGGRGGGWTRPVRGGTMTNPFGRPNSRYKSGHHTGMDFAVPTGTPVYAAAAGKVIRVTSGGAYGTRIEIEHGGSVWTLYAHLSGTSVSVGDEVSAGQVIGAAGNSGTSTGSHLHFEVRQGQNKYANTVDPSDYLNGSTTPVAYVQPGGDIYSETTTTRPMSTLDLLEYKPQADQMAVELSKPYVYMNPVDMMAASNIPLGTDTLALMGAGPDAQEENPPTAILESPLNEAEPLEPDVVA